jgi:predicted nucleic acid-binding protein
MATTGVDSVFVDTDVLVYATLGDSTHCFAARRLIDQLERANTELWISQQVLREFVAAMTRPQGPSAPLPIHEVITLTRRIERRFCVAEEHQLVREQLYLLIEQIPTGGRQIHDANLVATMLAFGVRRLATFNIADFQRFKGLIELVM